MASPFAAISAALALLALLTARKLSWWPYAAGGMLLAGTLSARWLPPSVWVALGAASAAHDAWNWSVPKCLAAAGLAWTVAWSGLERWTQEWQLRWAVLFALAMCCAPIFWHWQQTPLLPQAHRFRIEMEAAVALLAAFGLREFCTRVGRRHESSRS